VPHARTSAVAAAALPPRPRASRRVDLHVLAGAVGAELVGHPVEVSGVTLRAAEVRPGDLFAALPGSRAHGADFVAQARAAGAVALLTDPAGLDRARTADLPVLVHPEPRAVLGTAAAVVHGDPTQRLRVLGVTGTSGKTTVAHLLEAGLAAAGRTTGLVGTVGVRVAGRALPSAFTTPEAPDLQALFAVMRDDGVTDVAMEVSSHALALGRVAGTCFAVGAFTNLSQDHLDFHGSMEDYYLAKASLFTPDRAVRAVVCVDDEWGRRLVRESGVPVASVSSRQEVPADWHIQPTGGDESAFELVGAGGRLSLRSALPGDFNRVNTGVAALVLLAAGYARDAIEQALTADPHVPGRMERVSVPDIPDSDQSRLPLAVVDFAHTPGAVAAALKALRHNTAGSLIVVLGAGGDRDPGKRAAMGAAAAAHADLLVVTDDNPRSEDPASIRAAVLAGAVTQQRQAASSQSSHGNVREVADRAAAIREAVAGAGAGDTVVVLGKGHEVGQDTAGTVHPFDDRSELRAALRAALTDHAPGRPSSQPSADVISGDAR